MRAFMFTEMDDYWMITDLNSFTSLHNAEAHKERLDKHSFLQKLPWREREREREQSGYQFEIRNPSRSRNGHELLRYRSFCPCVRHIRKSNYNLVTLIGNQRLAKSNVAVMTSSSKLLTTS